MNERTKARLKHWGDLVYRNTPNAISKIVYDMGRASLFKEERQESFMHAFEHIARENIDGDYLEFGCYRGASLIMAGKIASRLKLRSMRFFAFDSFEGLPASEGRLFRKGAYSCSLQAFNEYVTKAGIPASRVVPVAGMYENTLTEDLKRRHSMRKAALIHIDCNLYSSTQEALRFIEDLLGVGSVLIFDDWYRHEAGVAPDNFGERKAFREWEFRDRFRPLENPGARRVNKTFVFAGHLVS